LSIPITKLVLGEEEVQAVAAVIRSGWIAMGPRTAAFERAVADRVGARHAVAVSSCTSALHLGLLAVGIGPGDEVICPSLSYIATANAVLHAGATPRFVEVDRRTYNLDPAGIEGALTPRSRALIVVHQLGLPAEMGPLRALADHHGLCIVEDAACALGATTGGQPVGAATRDGVCCFSFHPRKIITTGEGGMIVTDDDALAERLRRLRDQGMSIPAALRHDATAVLLEEYRELGYNFRLTDLQAALGLEQLRRLPELLARRRALARRYSERLAAWPELGLPHEPEGAEHSFQSYMVLLGEDRSRRAIMQALAARGVASRRGVMAIHQTPLYRERFPGVSLPLTEAIARRGLVLPLYPQMTEVEQDAVVAALDASLREAQGG
jgi:perosamine synthetase